MGQQNYFENIFSWKVAQNRWCHEVQFAASRDRNSLAFNSFAIVTRKLCCAKYKCFRCTALEVQCLSKWRLLEVGAQRERRCAALRSSYCIAPSELQAFAMAQWVKNLPAMQETWIQFLGQEDPLEEEMATHFSILAWKIPWAEEPGRSQSKELQRVEHDWVTKPIRATDVKESKCELRSSYSRL